MQGDHIRVSLVSTNSTVSAVKSDAQSKELNQMIDQSGSGGTVGGEVSGSRRFDTIEIDGERRGIEGTVGMQN